MCLCLPACLCVSVSISVLSSVPPIIPNISLLPCPLFPHPVAGTEKTRMGEGDWVGACFSWEGCLHAAGCALLAEKSLSSSSIHHHLSPSPPSVSLLFFCYLSISTSIHAMPPSLLPTPLKTKTGGAGSWAEVWLFHFAFLFFSLCS